MVRRHGGWWEEEQIVCKRRKSTIQRERPESVQDLMKDNPLIQEAQ